MKKWVEVRRGYVVETSSMRTVSAGENTTNDLKEGKCLYIGFVGGKNRLTINFPDVKSKWAGYQKLLAVLDMSKWVEVRKGHIVEVSAVRTVNTGDSGAPDTQEGRCLYLTFTGAATMTIPFANAKDKWAGYDKILTTLEEIQKPNE